MSVCPKCGQKLHLYNLSQKCPKCGVNMRFYDFDVRFYRDAKKAELSMANVHSKVRSFKAAMIGGTLPIVRLCLTLLPLFSTLIPFANAAIRLPFCSRDIAMSTLGIYTMFSDGTLDYIREMTQSQSSGLAFSAMFELIICAAITAAMALIIVLLTIFCFFSIKKMSVALCTVSALGAASCVLSAVFASKFASAAAGHGGLLLGGSLSFGWAVSFVMFIAVFVVNLLIARKGLEVVLDEGDEERIKIYKQVRRGEVSIDDLPQPIVETTETRAIDEEIRKQQELFREKEQEKEAQKQ